LNGLTIDDPKSIEYWGYLANSCLQLELYDTALYAYRRGEQLMKVDDHSQWIVANIGNLLTNKGLPTEACEYLERAAKYEARSEYAHDRLAGALKKRAEEEKKFEKQCALGKRRVREEIAKLLTVSPLLAEGDVLGIGGGAVSGQPSE
jgi:tetratricopeptide (TPR) repeat protein